MSSLVWVWESKQLLLFHTFTILGSGLVLSKRRWNDKPISGQYYFKRQMVGGKLLHIGSEAKSPFPVIHVWIWKSIQKCESLPKFRKRVATWTVVCESSVCDISECGCNLWSIRRLQDHWNVFLFCFTPFPKKHDSLGNVNLILQYRNLKSL